MPQHRQDPHPLLRPLPRAVRPRAGPPATTARDAPSVAPRVAEDEEALAAGLDGAEDGVGVEGEEAGGFEGGVAITIYAWMAIREGFGDDASTYHE